MKVMNLNLFQFSKLIDICYLFLKNNKSTIFHVGSIASNEGIGSLSYNVAKVGLVAYARSFVTRNEWIRYSCKWDCPGAFECENNAMSRLKKKI